MSSSLVYTWLIISLMITYSNGIRCDQSNECANAEISCDQRSNCQIYCHGNSSCSNSIINCPTNHACHIQCDGDFGCMNSIINCPYNAQCDVDCPGDSSCTHTHINGGTDTQLLVQCRNSKSCTNAIIDARDSSGLNVKDCIYEDSCIGITVYCPEYNVDHLGIHKRCTISGDNNVGGYDSNPMTIYAVNGWNDVNMQTTSSNRFGVMYCNDDYSANCNIASGGNNDEWQCDPNNEQNCQPTSVPTVDPTNGPTVAPTDEPFCNHEDHAMVHIEFSYTFNTKSHSKKYQIANILKNISYAVEKDVAELTECTIIDDQHDVFILNNNTVNNTAIINTSICYICNGDEILDPEIITNQLDADFVDIVDEVVETVNENDTITLHVIHDEDSPEIHVIIIKEQSTTPSPIIIDEETKLIDPENNLFWIIIGIVIVSIIICVVSFILVIVNKVRKDNKKYDYNEDNGSVSPPMTTTVSYTYSKPKEKRRHIQMIPSESLPSKSLKSIVDEAHNDRDVDDIGSNHMYVDDYDDEGQSQHKLTTPR